MNYSDAVTVLTFNRKGSLEPIGILFTDLAEQPVPPQMLIELLGLVSDEKLAEIRHFFCV
jgi:hypothetical protein